jgi:hypothetical protein
MTIKKFCYVQALPGTGKTSIIERLHNRGIFAVDGDDITRVFPQKFFPHIGERFKQVIDGLNCPDVILSSYWSRDFEPALKFEADLVFFKGYEAWMDDIRASRLDLIERFDEETLMKWVQDYESMYMSPQRFLGPEVTRLGHGEYLNHYIDKIEAVTKLYKMQGIWNGQRKSKVS